MVGWCQGYLCFWQQCGKRENLLIRKFSAIEGQGGGICRTGAASASQSLGGSSRTCDSHSWARADLERVLRAAVL